VIIVDESKLVERLGSRFAVPVEVVRFGMAGRRRAGYEALGAKTTLRTSADGKPFVTDGGHYILDCAFGPIASPRQIGFGFEWHRWSCGARLVPWHGDASDVAGESGVKVLLPAIIRIRCEI